MNDAVSRSERQQINCFVNHLMRRTASHTKSICIPSIVHGMIHEPQEGNNGSDHKHLSLLNMCISSSYSLAIQDSSAAQLLGVSGAMPYPHEQINISNP